MTRDDIIRMALEAGFEAEVGDVWISEGYWADELELFAALVAAAEREKFTVHAAALVRDARHDATEREREACAKVCDKHWDDNGQHCANAIRARGKE